MAIIEWSDDFSVGVAQLDEQHKKLVEIINKLHSAMIDGTSKEKLKEIINKLIEYTSYHFKSEETLFEQFDYEDTDSHIEEHKKFVEKVMSFKKEFDEGITGITLEIITFLKDWLLNHIKGTDKKYTKCFNENGLR